VRCALVPAALLLLAVADVACVDDNIPARPMVVADSDGGAGSSGGGDDAGEDAFDDVGASDGGPVLLASSPTCGGIKLVVSGGMLFWTEELTGMVRSVPTSGGRPTTIAAGQVFPRSLTVDRTSIYWVEGDTRDIATTHDAIMKRPLGGGATTVFVPAKNLNDPLGGENAINALLSADGWLYFARYIYTYRIPTDGNTPTPIAASPDTDMGKPGAFALGGAYLYQVEIDQNNVTRERIDGTQFGMTETGATEKLAPDRIAVSRGGLVTDAIALDDDYVVWANGPGIESKLGNTLENQGTLGVIANSAGFNQITGFVLSGVSVFLGESSMNAVEVAPLVKVSDNVPAPVAQVIATNQKDPSQFAADDTSIYWRTSDCRILKLARP
jgi:hypothetical protein